MPEQQGKFEDRPKKELSRREKIEEKDGLIKMPEVVCGEHLIKHLFEIGPTMQAGLGGAPISFQEIKAWQEVTKINLNGWEARILKRLSNDYLIESQKARDSDYPAPYMPEENQPSKAEIASSMKESMKKLAKL